MACLAFCALLTFGAHAEAHALVRFSDPPDGATLTRPPSVILIGFTETPDPKLSQLTILDTSGNRIATGPMVPVTGAPSSISFSPPALTDGVYTVNWRTVSAIDGHVATGAFAFAVGNQPVPPIAIVTPPPAAPPSALGVIGRWGLDAGYGLLLGGAWVDLLAFADISLGVLLVVGLGDLLALIGAAMVAEAARENAGVDWSTFLGTSLAHGIELIIVPVLIAGIAVIAAWRLAGAARRASLTVCAGMGVLAMLANAVVSHAASSPLPWLMIPLHWLHVLAYAVWIGGLAAVLVGIRGLPTEAKARAVGRFSVVAGFAFGTMILTGLVRGIDEVGSLPNLFTTTFGLLILAKTALFFTIAPLAATNRWRYVRLGVSGIPPLRWVSRGELSLAAVIMVAAAFLTTLPPPSFVVPLATHRFPQIVAQTNDSSGTVHVTLSVAPGTPGINRFTLNVRELHDGAPVADARLYLLFDLPAHPELGESILELRNLGSGNYSAVAARLSLAGAWSLTSVIETPRTTYDAVLTIETPGRR